MVELLIIKDEKFQFYTHSFEFGNVVIIFIETCKIPNVFENPAFNAIIFILFFGGGNICWRSFKAPILLVSEGHLDFFFVLFCFFKRFVKQICLPFFSRDMFFYSLPFPIYFWINIFPKTTKKNIPVGWNN